MTKVHVLHVIDSLAYGGKERMAIDIVNATKKKGYRASLCISRGEPSLNTEFDDKNAFFYLSRKNRFDLFAIQRFNQYLKDENVTIIHSHGRYPFAFASICQTIGMMNIPMLLHDHLSFQNINDEGALWLRKIVKIKASRYVSVSENNNRWAKRAGIDKQKVKIIGNAIDQRRFQHAKKINLHNKYQVPSNHKIGVVIGNLRHQKGIKDLIQAVSQIKAPQFTILVVGRVDDDSAYTKECHEAIDHLNLNGKIKMIGPSHDIPNILKSAEFAVMPSVHESGPLVLIEYMVSGLAFVSTLVGNVSLRLKEMGISTFVESGDVSGLASGIEKLLGMSEAERSKIGALNRDTAKSYFDISKTMDQWYETYEELLQR